MRLTQRKTGRLIADIEHINPSVYEGTASMTLTVEPGFTADEIRDGVLATDERGHVMSVSVESVDTHESDILITFRLIR